THLGTHVDPPSHYLEGGYAVDEIPLENLVGPGLVLDLRGRPVIDRQALEQAPLEDHRRVLFKTDNGPRLFETAFFQDYVHLTEDGAEYLVEKGVLLVGNDYCSIERYKNPGAPVHRTLLGAGTTVLECVNLVDVPAGPYEIFCLPLRIRWADGAPARVVLRG
ncbi:MAG: cyclase family protein, partial [Desulfarculaceae bacterium]